MRGLSASLRDKWKLDDLNLNPFEFAPPVASDYLLRSLSPCRPRPSHLQASPPMFSNRLRSPHNPMLAMTGAHFGPAFSSRSRRPASQLGSFGISPGTSALDATPFGLPPTWPFTWAACWVARLADGWPTVTHFSPAPKRGACLSASSGRLRPLAPGRACGARSPR